MSFALSVFNIPWLESYAVPEFCLVSKQGFMKARVMKARGGGGETKSDMESDLDLDLELDMESKSDMDMESKSDMDMESKSDMESNSDMESDMESDLEGIPMAEELHNSLMDVFVYSDYFDDTSLIPVDPVEKEEEKEE